MVETTSLPTIRSREGRRDMGGGRYLGWLLVAAGAALVVVSALADALWDDGVEYAFGWEQKAGVLVGCSIVAAVVVRARRRHQLAG
jgi:hypothetical protein